MLQWVPASRGWKILIPWVKSHKNLTDKHAVVLILDGAAGHTLCPEVGRALLDANIYTIYLPPHTTGVLQLCDTSLFGPVKSNFRTYVDRLQELFKRDIWLPVFVKVRQCALCHLPVHWSRWVVHSDVEGGYALTASTESHD